MDECLCRSQKPCDLVTYHTWFDLVTLPEMRNDIVKTTKYMFCGPINMSVTHICIRLADEWSAFISQELMSENHYSEKENL